MFATTERLIIRAARESDAAQILAMKNDLRVRRTTEINYPVPVGPKGGREYIELSDSRLFFAIIELKPVNEDSAQDNDARWVGVCSLDWASGQKNRDASTDIALRPAHWGKGYGTEIMRWLVDWGFEQIGLHRISLDVFVNNPAAIALYKKLCVRA